MVHQQNIKQAAACATVKKLKMLGYGQAPLVKYVVGARNAKTSEEGYATGAIN